MSKQHIIHRQNLLHPSLDTVESVVWQSNLILIPLKPVTALFFVNYTYVKHMVYLMPRHGRKNRYDWWMKQKKKILQSSTLNSALERILLWTNSDASMEVIFFFRTFIMNSACTKYAAQSPAGIFLSMTSMIFSLVLSIRGFSILPP